jgi:hypothetical protein
MLTTPHESALQQRLLPFFDQHGYVLIPEKKQFRKFIPQGFLNVILTVSSYDDETLIEVNFGCRNDQIEQIAQQFLGHQEEYRDDANTLVISIGKFNEAKYFRYKVIEEEDIQTVCAEIERFFVERGFLFFQQSHTVEQLDHVLNDQPHKTCKFLYNQIHRYFKGLVVAKLRNRENFLDLTDIYRRQMIRTGATSKELHEFERLVGYMLYLSVN